MNIAKLLEPEKFQNDYLNRPEYQEMEKYKAQIIEKFKNGKSYTTCDKEGHGELKLNNGVYEYKYESHFSDDDYSCTYKTDEELLKYLYSQRSWELNHGKTEKDIYKSICERLY